MNGRGEPATDLQPRDFPPAPRGSAYGTWLAICCLVPVAAVMLVVVDGERVAFWFLPEATFPDVCWSRRVFGFDCPFCGLTRSIVHLCHARWEASLAMHRFGWLVFLAITVHIPLLGWQWRRARNGTESRFGHWQVWFWGSLAVLLTLNRIWEVLGG